MTIEEAIKEQQDYLAAGYLLGNPKLSKAIALGCEALKFILKLRRYDIEAACEELPGETEGKR